MTHEQGTPWTKTVEQSPGLLTLNKDIPQENIQTYFSEKLKALSPAQV